MPHRPLALWTRALAAALVVPLAALTACGSNDDAAKDDPAQVQDAGGGAAAEGADEGSTPSESDDAAAAANPWGPEGGFPIEFPKDDKAPTLAKVTLSGALSGSGDLQEAQCHLYGPDQGHFVVGKLPDGTQVWVDDLTPGRVGFVNGGRAWFAKETETDRSVTATISDSGLVAKGSAAAKAGGATGAVTFEIQVKC